MILDDTFPPAVYSVPFSGNIRGSIITAFSFFLFVLHVTFSDFFLCFHKFQVAGVVRSRSIEMVEALYNMNRVSVVLNFMNGETSVSEDKFIASTCVFFAL